MKLIEQPTFNQTSNFSLIFANLIPIYGVLFLGWKVFDIVIFYWLETIIIGLFNVIKINMCQGEAPKDDAETAKSMGPFFEWMHEKSLEAQEKQGIVKERVEAPNDLMHSSKIFISIFFLIHYNFFIFIQFAIIVGFMSPKLDPFDFFEVITHVYQTTDFVVAGIIGIIISHAHSLYENFYKGGEYLVSNAGVQMFKPYVRIFIQQFVVIIGGGAAMMIGAPMAVLILLVALKIAVDLISHNYSHKQQQQVTS